MVKSAFCPWFSWHKQGEWHSPQVTKALAASCASRSATWLLRRSREVLPGNGGSMMAWFWMFFGDCCSEYLSFFEFFGGSIVTTHTGGSVIWVTSWQGPDEQLGGEKKVGDWDNPPLFAVKKVAVVVLIIVVLVIVYSIYSQLQLYISYVCIYIHTHCIYVYI